MGNLYLNRGITGAVVERQPFGGVKLSGIGSKAGGPDYLLQFLEPRTISENTLRHGFVPPEELMPTTCGNSHDQSKSLILPTVHASKVLQTGIRQNILP